MPQRKSRSRRAVALGALAIVGSVLSTPGAGAASKANNQKPFPSDHECADQQFYNSHRDLCDAIQHLIAPETSQNSDILPIPHRGLWGTDDDEGPSENTMGALKNALNNGYRIMEIDTALSDIDRLYPNVYLGHYFDKHAFNPYIDPRYAFIISTSQMKKRSMKRGALGDDDLTELVDALNWARSHQVLLMIDPKVPADPLPNEYAKIIALTIRTALQHSALANVVIKTDRSFEESVSEIRSITGLPYSSFKGEVLWSPIINKSASTSMSESIERFHDWEENTDNGADVAMYEVGIFGTCHWASEPISYNAVTYDNLIDLVMHASQNWESRPSLWSLDPANYLGTLSRQYTWKMIGNNNACRTPPLVSGEPDMRGDPYSILEIKWAKFSVMNTDVPGFYNQFGE